VSLNFEQRQYCEYLGTLEPKDKCWCGWFRKEECWSGCEKRGKGLTCADKIKEACSECGNTPYEPGAKITHLINCSHSRS